MDFEKSILIIGRCVRTSFDNAPTFENFIPILHCDTSSDRILRVQFC